MALPDNINFDRLIAEILSDMEHVADGWSKGRPQDETALLNRLTERLSRSRRKCDVGVGTPIGLEAEFFELHRRGKNQTDKYGADFAVTIHAPVVDFKKTAFFQLKKSKDYQATLTAEQLDQASLVDSIRPRSFVLTVDEVRLGFRVRSVTNCRSEIPADNGSRQFSVAEWDFLVVWLLKWFRCKEGLPTETTDPEPVEGLLRDFRMDSPTVSSAQIQQQNIPDGFCPARAWLY